MSSKYPGLNPRPPSALVLRSRWSSASPTAATAPARRRGSCRPAAPRRRRSNRPRSRRARRPDSIAGDVLHTRRTVFNDDLADRVVALVGDRQLASSRRHAEGGVLHPEWLADPFAQGIPHDMPVARRLSTPVTSAAVWTSSAHPSADERSVPSPTTHLAAARASP